MRASRFLSICLIPISISTQEASIVLLSSDLADGFYGVEAPFRVDTDTWLGLLRTQDGYTLAPATLEWHELERAEGADGPTFELSSNVQSPVAFFSNVPALEAGNVSAASPTWVDLSSASSAADVSLGDTSYLVSVDSKYPDECRATIVLSDGAVTQEIEVEGVSGCGDPHFTVHWAGDLDADDQLDLIATFSMKYSFHPRQLYLSSAAAPGQLVGLAGLTDRTAG